MNMKHEFSPHDSPQVHLGLTTYVGCLVGRPVEVTEALISSQLLDSMAAVRLIEFIERTFDVAIRDEDLKLENFDSIQAILKLVDPEMRAKNKRARDEDAG